MITIKNSKIIQINLNKNNRKLICVKSIQDDKESYIKNEIKIAIKEAQEVCKKNNIKDCILAWEKVDDLEFEYDKTYYNKLTDLENYCLEEPSSEECKIYEI